MGAAKALIYYYQEFVSQKSMLKRLYGEEEMVFNEIKPRFSNDDSSQKQFRDILEKRKEFNTSFCVYMMISCLRNCCCCFIRCCGPRCRRQLVIHKKF